MKSHGVSLRRGDDYVSVRINLDCQIALVGQPKWLDD